MPKAESPRGRSSPDACQIALDSLDVIGRREWDVSSDRVRVDAFLALPFQVDPDEAEEGIPLGAYEAAIHADDRERVIGMIRRSAEEGTSYVIGYRLIRVDGRTRWVLARGRFAGDHVGRPAGGRGFLVDVTALRESEDSLDGTQQAAGASPLDRAAEHAIAARAAIMDFRMPS